MRRWKNFRNVNDKFEEKTENTRLSITNLGS